MDVGLFLQSFGFFGGGLGEFFFQLEQLGFFTYALPFLIIFALVFGVLTRMQLFGPNKVIYSILSLSISFMALQFGFVSQFFADIFPQLGIWLSVILVIFIILGLFNPRAMWNKGLMMLVGLVILTIILWKSFGLNWYNTGYWLPENWVTFFVIILILVAIGSIISNTPKGKPFSWGKTLENMFESSSYGGQNPQGP